jgi:hypothetical protein
MRCAIAEAVVADELATAIFRDFYAGKETEAKLGGLRSALGWPSKEHQDEAAIIRCQLAKVCGEPRKVHAVAAQAAHDVCTALRWWLNDTAQGPFAEGLRGIFVEAMGIWQHLQRTRQGAEAAMDRAFHNWMEQTDARPQYGSIARSEPNAQQQPTSGPMDPLAVLFPQIWVGENLIFHGFALFPTQTAVVAAAQERTGPQSLRAVHRRRTSDMGGRSRTEQGTARQVVNNASGSAMAPRRPSLPATPAQSDFSFSGRLGNSQPLQGRVDPAASVSSRSRRSERDGSGD